MAIDRTTDELLSSLGAGLRDLRLQQDLGQAELAARAGVGRSAIQNLEAGRGNLTTLARVVRALGKAEWLLALAPATTINPLHLVQQGKKRQRASGKRSGKPTSD